MASDNTPELAPWVAVSAPGRLDGAKSQRVVVTSAPGMGVGCAISVVPSEAVNKPCVQNGVPFPSISTKPVESHITSFGFVTGLPTTNDFKVKAWVEFKFVSCILKMVLPEEANPFAHSAGVTVTVKVLFASVKVNTREPSEGQPPEAEPFSTAKFGVLLLEGQLGMLGEEPSLELPRLWLLAASAGVERPKHSSRTHKTHEREPIM